METFNSFAFFASFSFRFFRKFVYFQESKPGEEERAQRAHRIVASSFAPTLSMFYKQRL